MAYDRMDWHYGADDFPKELDSSCGGTHIGMYLAWIIQNDLIGYLHIEESLNSISKVKAKEMTGTEFLVKECDEKFWEEDLNEIGQAFTKDYYESNQYFGDYDEVLGSEYPSLYHVHDSWENFEKISIVLSKRFKNWRSSQSKSWWKFWE